MSERHTTKAGAFCNCYHEDCGEFCQCKCHQPLSNKVKYDMDDRKRKAWDFIFDRVKEELPIYMDDVSVLQLAPVGIQKFMTWLIDVGYTKDNDSPRFIYKGSK